MVNVNCRWSLGSVYNTRISDSAQNLFISISKIDKRIEGSHEGKVDLKSLSVLHRSCLNQRTAQNLTELDFHGFHLFMGRSLKAPISASITPLSSPFKLADSEGVDT